MPKVLINGVPTDVSLDQIFQDDGTTPFGTTATQAVTGGRTFTEAEVEAIRAQEKDKLYGQLTRTTEELTSLREQVGGLTAEQQRREAALAEEQARLEREAQAKEEEELTSKQLLDRRQKEWEDRLAQTEQTFNSRLEAEEQKRQEAVALAAKEREFSDLREYITTQIAANADNIAPQLVQFVGGNTREEVDANIARAIEGTNQITAEMQSMLNPQQIDPATGQPVQQFQQEFVQQPQPPSQVATPGVTPFSGPSAIDPSGQYSQQVTPEQIANMNMTEYSNFRSKMGIGGQQTNRGLYG